MEPIIETKGLTKKYGQKLAADSVDITVRPGEIYGLIGRNGAGKTTLLKMITGLIYPTAGEIRRNFHDKTKKNIMGLLIESPGIFPEFDGKTNLQLKMTVLGLRDEGQSDELMDLVGLGGVRKKVKKYSLGMKQRLGLAMALIDDPELLILDEPTNGMDPQGMRDFRILIQSLVEKKKMTFIISSHILGELSKYATRFGIIEQGKLLKEIDRKELLEIEGDLEDYYISLTGGYDHVPAL